MERRYPTKERKGKGKEMERTNRLFFFSKALRSSIDHGGRKKQIDFCFSCESKVHERLIAFSHFASEGMRRP
jgi:hypothetical protein